MADALSLLFELTADGRPAVAEFQRVRKVFAMELDSVRKLASQAVRVNIQGSAPGQADAHVKEFRRIEREAARSAKTQEREQVRLNRAVESLQRQRSAAIIASLKAEERAAIASARAQERAFSAIGPGLQSAGRALTVGLTAPLLALGAASVKSTKDIDANVNTLKAFTGSAEAAEKRLAELIKTARQTPGLTTNLALTLDAQLRTAKVTEETINRVLPAIGRLNAVSKLPDAGRFTQNLLQLITQNFERQDLKELVGQSPLAGQLITEIFNVDSPVNAKAIREQAKKMGLTTVDAFFAAFAEAAQRNQGLATVTESIGSRFDKLVDRIQVALRPLGLAIINSIEPFVEPFTRLIERVAAGFNALPQALQILIVVAGGVAAALGPVLFLLGSLVQSITTLIPALVSLNAIGLLPTLTNLRLIGQVMVGTASLTAGATATAVVATAGWAALAIALGAVAIATFSYLTAGQKLVPISAAQAKAASDQLTSLREQSKFLGSLTAGVQRTTEEQRRLKDIYELLNREAPKRVGTIQQESEELAILRAGLEKIIKTQGAERQQQAAVLAGVIAAGLAEVESNEKRIATITEAIKGYTALAEVYRGNEAALTDEQRALAAAASEGINLQLSLSELESTIQALTQQSGDLRSETTALNTTLAEQSETLATLSNATGLSERQILLLAKSMGQFKGDVDATLRSLEAFRAQQGEGAKATKESTKEIDEQTRSLKELKRALKEAEIASRERSAATRRAFEEDKISSQEATRRLIADARQAAADQIKEIDATLEAKRRELEGADEEAAEKLRDEISELELRKKQVTSETAIEIAGLRAEQRRRERDSETAHQTSLLEIRRTAAQSQIDALQERMEREESFRLEGEQQIVAIERRITQAEEDELRRRLGQVAEGTEARRVLEDELSKFIEDKGKQRAEQARRLAKAELDSALLPVRRLQRQEGAETAGDSGVIARLRSLADEGRASFEASERQIGAIIDKGFERRINALKEEIRIRRQHNRDVSELNAELRTLEQERQNAAEVTDRATQQGRRDDLERERSYLETLHQIRLEALDLLRDASAIELSRLVSRFGDRRLFRLRALELERERNEAEHQERLRQIEQERQDAEKRFKGVKDAEEKLLALRRHFADLEKAERARRAAEREKEDDDERDARDPFTSLRKRFDDFRFAIEHTNDAISDSLGALAQQVNASIDAMVGAFGQAIAANILYGESIGKALKAALAQQLAVISAEAAIQALKHAAYAVGSLAFGNYAAAAKHAQAAALFGALAIAAGVAGRALSRSAGLYDRGRASSTASAATSGSAESQSREFQYGGQAVEPSSSASREGSAGARVGFSNAIQSLAEEVKLVRMENAALTARLDGTLSRIGSLPAGDVVTIGAAAASPALGAAVIQHSKENADFNRDLATNLGF